MQTRPFLRRMKEQSWLSAQVLAWPEQLLRGLCQPGGGGEGVRLFNSSVAACWLPGKRSKAEPGSSPPPPHWVLAVLEAAGGE